MAIYQSDIKLEASKVMADVPEGGGGPSGIALLSGKSNNIFEDITEVARAGGSLSLRQIFLAIRSKNADNGMAANIIISEPADDINVNIVLMSTAHDFATRSEDMSRLESGFLASGMYNGYLFGQHLPGQRLISIWQRPESVLPVIGARLPLVYREGFADTFTQYVSVQRIATNNVQTFVDASGEFQMRVLGVEIGQPLARSFPGFDAQRQTPTESALNQRTKIRTAIWAPVASYYGIKPLTAVANIDEFVVQCAGIYERIVPSSESETPIDDARINRQINTLMQVGNAVDLTVNRALVSGTNLYIGAAVLPGTLAICPVGNETALLTDQGGMAMFGGVQVGTVDYVNGIVTPMATIFGTAQQLRIKYVPAVDVPADITSVGMVVTAENRRMNYVSTLPFPVARGSLQVHFAVQGRWYVLTDDGSGALRGTDASHGAGSFNHSSRTLTATLPALPDVGSAIIINYAVDTNALAAANFVDLEHPRFVIPINSDGEISLADGSQAFEPGRVLVEWEVAGQARAAWDNGLGTLSGAAGGTVDYQAGKLLLIPYSLPAKGTVIKVSTVRHSRTAQPVNWAITGNTYKATLPELPKPGTVQIPFSLPLRAGTNAPGYAFAQSERTIAGYVTDTAEGALVFQGVTVGTIDHATGAIEIVIDQAATEALGGKVVFDLTRVSEVTIN